MDVEGTMEGSVSGIASCIGEPARARMLYCLLDGRARTSTELGIIAQVSASTASAHLARLKEHHLVRVLAQGKHRYYSLTSADVARALEALSVVAGGAAAFEPSTPRELRSARTCYDHMAGELAVELHDRLFALGWLATAASGINDYALNPAGVKGLERLGVNVEALRAKRRRFAFACLDWSERKPHIGGAVGAALLELAVGRAWVTQDMDSRRLSITRFGFRELRARFAIDADAKIQRTLNANEFAMRG